MVVSSIGEDASRETESRLLSPDQFDPIFVAAGNHAFANTLSRSTVSRSRTVAKRLGRRPRGPNPRSVPEWTGRPERTADPHHAADR